MFYFIPSWYTNNWMYEEKTWFRRPAPLYDETLSQLHLFSKVNEPCTIFSLAYMPHMRSFLDREGFSTLPRINIFDDLQGIKEEDFGLYSYRDLNWEEDLTWISTPFVMMALKENKLYAKVHFNQEGRLLSIEFFLNDKCIRQMFFDDRGFISSILDMNASIQEFYNDQGECVFTWDQGDDHVDVNPSFKKRFDKLHYSSLTALIEEALHKRIASFQKDDPIVMAAHLQHRSLFQKLRRPFIITIYEDRYPFDDEYIKDFHHASFIIADHAYKADLLRQNPALTYTPIYHMTPYDTRFTPGISQRLKTLKIYLPITYFDDILSLKEILEYMQNHPYVELHIGLNSPDQAFKNQINEHVTPLCEKYHIPMEQDVVDEISEMIKPRVYIHQIISRSDLMKVLHETRLIVDLREHPDIILQVASISVGIPTIVSHEVEYIRHLGNGIVLSHNYTLKEALAYYLESLNHWNEALVYCFDLIQDHTKDRLVKKWKDILNDLKEAKYE